jgi:hypothetical protein
VHRGQVDLDIEDTDRRLVVDVAPSLDRAQPTRVVAAEIVGDRRGDPGRDGALSEVMPARYRGGFPSRRRSENI